jgi:hypothetical protein
MSHHRLNDGYDKRVENVKEAPMVERDLVLVVNVRQRWREVGAGTATAEEVVMGDWNLERRGIDPRRVAGVVGCYRHGIVAAFPVDGEPIPRTGYDPPRVRFPAGPRLRHLDGLPAPYRWARGEQYPVHEISLSAFPLDAGAGVQRIDLDGFTLSVAANGEATLVVPNGRAVTVLSGIAA